MRRHSSVLWLMVQRTFGRVIILLVGIIAVQAVLLREAVQKLEFGNYSLEQALDQGHVAGAAGVGLIIMTAMLCMAWEERGHESFGYTLRRLSVSERMIVLWQAVYHGGCYLLMWATQMLGMMALAQWYTQIADPAIVTGQTVFLAFYRHGYLHGLLPMLDVMYWIRNLGLLIALSLSSAYFVYARRRGKTSVELLAMLLLIMIFFGAYVDMAGAEGMVIVFSAVCIALILWRLWREENAYEE